MRFIVAALLLSSQLASATSTNTACVPSALGPNAVRAATIAAMGELAREGRVFTTGAESLNDSEARSHYSSTVSTISYDQGMYESKKVDGNDHEVCVQVWKK
ncbi:hypothetical protein [uncultured Photobacterium sp.]|uniref:hypothetical protein n=1 Tax=uncultured Photobacterium sp. TaxID=173973 RepID=UPI002606BE86|nr:hypothetical protein [uncultured Photobacterium sp.]